MENCSPLAKGGEQNAWCGTCGVENRSICLPSARARTLSLSCFDACCILTVGVKMPVGMENCSPLAKGGEQNAWCGTCGVENRSMCLPSARARTLSLSCFDACCILTVGVNDRTCIW